MGSDEGPKLIRLPMRRQTKDPDDVPVCALSPALPVATPTLSPESKIKDDIIVDADRRSGAESKVEFDVLGRASEAALAAAFLPTMAM